MARGGQASGRIDNSSTLKVSPRLCQASGMKSDTSGAQRYTSCSKLKLDSLFVQFFSLPETQELVLRLLDDIKAGRPVGAMTSNRRAAAASAYHGFTPPLSPKKSGVAPVSPSKPSPSTPTLRLATQQPLQQRTTLRESTARPVGLPQFYFPPPEATREAARRHLELRALEHMGPANGELPLPRLKLLLRDVFSLPVCLAYPVLHKLAPGSDDAVPTTLLCSWLAATGFAALDPAARLFEALRSTGDGYLTQSDFRPLLRGILLSHPGLAFLQDSPEFQERYAETVIHRMFYKLNPTGSGHLRLRELRRGDLLDALAEVEREDDVNRCLRYFSYEHFYVIYCKFWDLDADHDFLLSRDDLLRYANHALTYRIADRLFGQAARPFTSGVPGRMGYEDFVWFILSEEDKTSDAALHYWFRACDLNGDSRLTPDELLWFYEEQLRRMECLSQEVVGFKDVLAQMQDMLSPEDASCFTMRDLKRSRALAGTLFNVLFNLNKFVAFETKDPFQMRQEREDAASGASEWDRFARGEYMRLAVEEEGGDGGDEDGMRWAVDTGL